MVLNGILEELYLGYHDTGGNCLQLIEPNTPIPCMANNWLESGALAVYSSAIQFTYGNSESPRQSKRTIVWKPSIYKK